MVSLSRTARDWATKMECAPAGGRARRARDPSPGPGSPPEGLVSPFHQGGVLHELIEARDEKRLLRLQRQMAAYKLVVIDELG
jgi:hypothetical protein